MENSGTKPKTTSGGLLSRRVMLIAVAQTSIALSALLKSLLLTRWFDRATYGTYMQILMVAQSIPPFLNLGLPDGIFYFGSAATPARRRMLIIYYYVVALAPSVLIVLLSGLLRLKVADWMTNPDLAAYAWLIGLYTVAHLFEGMTIPTLVTTARPRLLAVLSVVHTIYDVGAIGVAWLLDSSLSVVIGLGIAGIAAKVLIVLSVVLADRSSASAKQDATDEQLPSLGRQVAYCLPLAFAAGCGWLRRSVARFIVAGLYPPAQFAVFARGAFELPLVGMAATSMTQGIFPDLVALAKKDDYHSFVGLWKEAIYRTAVVIFPVAAIVAVLSEQLMVLLFSEKYVDSTPIFQIFLLLLPIRISIYTYILRALGMSYHVLGVSVVGLAGNAALGWAMCLKLGPSGAAWGTVSGELLVVIAILVMIWRRVQIPVSRLMPWGRLLHLLLVLVVPTAVALLLNWSLGHGTVAMLVVGTAFSVLYYLLARYSGAIAQRDVDMVRGWIQQAFRRPQRKAGES